MDEGLVRWLRIRPDYTNAVSRNLFETPLLTRVWSHRIFDNPGIN